MSELLLKCDTCGRLAHDPRVKNQVCDYRNLNGAHCRGTLLVFEAEPVFSEPYLLCDMCGRRADNLTLKNKICEWRLPDGRHCQGILKDAVQ